MNNPGYHTKTIQKGVYGEASKIREEFEEFLDAQQQGCAVMCLLELSDLLGAIRGWLEANHPSITLADLVHMTNITHRAFKNGHRD